MEPRLNMNENICRLRLFHSKYAILLVCAAAALLFPYAGAYDPLDPMGNITIKWDVVSWTPDGYVAAVTIHNFQQYRHVASPPGWKLGWAWAKKEVIWAMVGAQTTEQGDCSKWKASVPHCCSKRPNVVDLLAGVPYSMQFVNCCKGGALASWAQDPPNAIASFQVSVGQAGTTNKTVKLPKNFTLLAPGPGYTCGPATKVPASIFLSNDKRRTTQAHMTWNVTCTYSQFLVQKNPTCCVSLSSFYNDTLTPCPDCACNCKKNITDPCVEDNSPILKTPGINTPLKTGQPLLQCTRHMCPIRVHWHVKLNYKEYWRAKITITNFDYRINYTDWTLVAQHPNFNNVTQVFSWNYKPLTPYGSINDTAMFWGERYYNDMLMQAGRMGSVSSEILLKKDKLTFSLKQGWAFPRRLYFNGEECMLPPPDTYPWLPSSAHSSYSCNCGFLSSLLVLAILMFFL